MNTTDTNDTEIIGMMQMLMELEFTHFCPLAEVRLLKPGIQRRWLAKDAPLPFRFASRFFNRFPVALPLRCFHLEEVSSRPPLSSNIFGRDPLSNVSYWNCGRPKLSKSP